MPSDRMMRAIGRLERAVSRIEHSWIAHNDEAGSRSDLPMPGPDVDRDKAKEALQALDTLLNEMRGSERG